jgi:hypothetical protein
VNFLRPNLFSLRVTDIAASSAADLSPAREPWLLPQRLSLETPLIAMVWQLLFAHEFQIWVSSTTLAVATLCVWMIYVSDHLLDARRGLLYSSRHRFVAQHARAFVAVLALAFLAAFVLSVFLPRPIFTAGVGLSVAVALYLFTIHHGGPVKRIFPKEAMVAMLFAAGSTIVVWTDPQRLPAAVTALIGFAGLCLANCVAVDTFEWQSVVERPHAPHRVVRWLGRHFDAMCVLLTFATAVLLRGHLWLVLAIASSAIMMMLVSRIRARFSAESVRLLTDLSLLIPPFALLVGRR